MYRGPLQGADWNAILGIHHGERLSQVLEPYLADRPQLRSASPELSELPAHLQHFGIDVDGIQTIPVEDMRQGVILLRKAMPARIWKRVNERICVMFASSVMGAIWFSLLRYPSWVSAVDAKDAQILKRLEEGINNALLTTPWINIGESLFSELECLAEMQDQVQRSFVQLLVYRLACEVALKGSPIQDVEHLTALLGLYQKGNYPVGITRDEELNLQFLVLVR